MERPAGKPLVELFIRQSPSDPDEKGACPFGQKWFMLLYMMMQRNLLNLRVSPVSVDRPPDDYVKLNAGRRLPVICVHDPESTKHEPKPPIIEADTDEAMEELFQRWNLDPELYSDPGKDVSGNILRNFNHFLRTGQERGLEMDLGSLERYLARNGYQFVDGDTASYMDCILAPKLQHIRIACSYFRGYTVSHEFLYIWTYLANVYELDAFRLGCPSDKDILLHYFDRVYPFVTAKVQAIKSEILMLPDGEKTLSTPTSIGPGKLGKFQSGLLTGGVPRPSAKPRPSIIADSLLSSSPSSSSIKTPSSIESDYYK